MFLILTIILVFCIGICLRLRALQKNSYLKKHLLRLEKLYFALDYLFFHLHKNPDAVLLYENAIQYLQSITAIAHYFEEQDGKNAIEHDRVLSHYLKDCQARIHILEANKHPISFERAVHHKKSLFFSGCFFCSKPLRLFPVKRKKIRFSGLGPLTTEKIRCCPICSSAFEKGSAKVLCFTRQGKKRLWFEVHDFTPHHDYWQINATKS